MRRDMDLVRTLMLRLEAVEHPKADMTEVVGDDDPLAVALHLALLIENGFAVGVDVGLNEEEPHWVDLDLTWSGHDFLESIRDAEMWRQAKDGAKKTGLFTLRMIAETAAAIGKNRLERLIASGELFT